MAYDDESGGGDDESDYARSHSDFDPTKEVGTDLDKATLDFLDETKEARILRVPAGASARGAAGLTTMDYIEYLRIDMELEPEMAWVAREMCAAPMPPNAEMLVSKSGIVYFHDLENDYYTVEHPLTQRYLKVLERERLYVLALRTKPAVNALVFHQAAELFNQQFPNLQVPCQDCGVMQSTLKCEQCVMSFCDACFRNLHANCEGPRKYHTTRATACGSFCSSCAKKKPQVYNGNSEEYFCYECFEQLHSKGNRRSHRAMIVSVSDAEVVEPNKKCEECEDNLAAFRCDMCLDNFCIPCFWRLHMNGERRRHTITKVTLNPLCNQCNATRATVFSLQDQELLCTDCFTFIHYKGNRQLHLFTDAMNILLLLEKLDPGFQEHMRRAIPRVLWAITNLQGWCRGIESRKQFRRHKDLVTKIQRRWRGAMTRKKLLSMLDQYKWRKKEISNYFLPKTRQERMVAKQKFAAQYGRKEVAYQHTAATLKELRETIIDSSAANTLEDVARTKQQMDEQALTMTKRKDTVEVQNAYILPIYSTAKRAVNAPGGGGMQAITAGSGAGQQQAIEDNRDRSMELTRKDIRGARDNSMRDLLRVEDKKE
jgi:hypothetical protein